MNCAVVMTTYNGEKMITGQLESLRNQSRKPDRVYIFDDCSADSTAELVKSYIERFQLKNWFFSVNPLNLGWKANFMQALDLAECDIMFPCDQDDSWMADKIELMMEQLETRPEISVLACDTKIEYEEGSIHSKHYEGRETKEEGRVVQYPLTSRFFMNPRPGNTYAVRKSFFEEIKEYWQQDFPHDEFMWISAALQGKAYLINKCLVEFHRHAGNASDIKYKDIAMQKKQLDYIGRSLEVFERMIADRKLIPLRNASELLSQAKIWCGKRKKLMETRNPLRWLFMAPWWKYYNSNKNALSDLYLVLFGKFRRN